MRRRGTVNAYATGQHSIVVAGYRASDGAPAIYSGAGRAHPGARLPDLAAISEESPAHRGVLAAGTYSGSCRMMNGTSVAAPQLTRKLADTVAAAAGVDAIDAGQATRALLRSPAVAACPPAEEERCGRGKLLRGLVPAHRRRIES